MDYSTYESWYEDGPEVDFNIWLMNLTENIDDKKVAEAVGYFFQLPENIIPVKDTGWMKFPVKVRLEASKHIAYIQGLL